MARPRPISSSASRLSSLRPAPGRSAPGLIAVDTSLAGLRTTGIGLYAKQLAAGLAAGPLRERLCFLGGAAHALPAHVTHVPARSRSRTLWMLGEVAPQLAQREAALFHGLANFPLPLARPRRTRFVLTVHDLIPLTHPEMVSRAFRVQFAVWLAHSLSLCDAVICDSEHTRSELAARFPAAPASVVALGADHVPRRVALSADGRPVVLYVGSLDVRKNVGVLLSAFEALPHARELSLVLAGQRAFGSDAVVAQVARLREAGLDVQLPGHLSEARLWETVASAAVLCCPSAAEGFGLPPLEGLALGTPVVASRIPAHEEVLGDAAVLTPPGDAAELAAALQRVLEDSELAQRLRGLGPRRAAQFSWRRCAEQTTAVYEGVFRGLS